MTPTVRADLAAQPSLHKIRPLSYLRRQRGLWQRSRVGEKRRGRKGKGCDKGKGQKVKRKVHHTHRRHSDSRSKSFPSAWPALLGHNVPCWARPSGPYGGGSYRSATRGPRSRSNAGGVAREVTSWFFHMPPASRKVGRPDAKSNKVWRGCL